MPFSLSRILAFGFGLTLIPAALAQTPITLTSVTPSTSLAGESSLQIRLAGSGFAAGMRLRIGNQERTIFSATSTAVTMSLASDDLALAGTYELRVVASDGRVSNPIPFQLNNPVPVLTNIGPSQLRAGAASQSILLNGFGLTRRSVVLWNGQPRPILGGSSGSSYFIQASALDLATPGAVNIRVQNPAPGGGESETAMLLLTLPFTGSDVVWDNVGRRLLASTSNGIVAIDPQTGLVSAPVPVGINPQRMAISGDGSKLWVALNGESALAKFSLPAITLEAKYPIGQVPNNFGGALGIEDIAVAPGRNDLVAASLMYFGSSPRHAGVAVFDAAGRRVMTTPGHTGSNVLQFGTDPLTVYGFNNETSEFGFRKMSISAAGITVDRVVTDSFQANPINFGFGAGFVIAQGKAFASGGTVFLPDSAAVVTKFSASGAIALNPRTDTVYYWPTFSSNTQVALYRTTTLQSVGVSQAKVGSVGFVRRFVAWGDQGLAYLTDSDLAVINELPLTQSLADVSPTAVVNGASFRSVPLAPGTVASIFGAGIGPAALAVAGPNGDRFPGEVGGVSVTFDGVPAPMLFSRFDQVSFVVPYSITGRPRAQVQLKFNGRASPPIDVQIGASSPAIFTLDSSGSGPGAILNQNGSVNTEQNPADRGTIVSVYMTGEGQTNPGGEDGKIALGTLAKPLLPVTARVGGLDAVIEYAGAAPGAIAGLMQVNLRVPAVTPGSRVPVLIQVGDLATPLGVTLAVR